MLARSRPAYPGRMKWVPLTSRPPVVAELVAGALNAEGIPTRVVRNGLGSVYGQHTFASRILVSDDDLHRATVLLREIETAEA